MNPFRVITNLFRSPLQPKLKQEIDEELRFHLEQRAAENIARGMPPEDAAREARKRFGNLQSVREDCREARGGSLFETTWRDVQFGTRMLRRNPGFTAIAVLTLTLGIGATSAVFSLVQGVLLTPPPYQQPNRIALIQPARLDGERYGRPCTTSQWLEWQTATNCFETIAGYNWDFQYLIRDDGSQFVNELYVTPEYFKVTGVQPLLGRAFSQTDWTTNGGTTAIIGYEFWQRQFHGDPNIIGKVVHLSRLQPQTIIGVMPPGLRFLPSLDNETEPNYDVNAKVDFWLPFWRPDLGKPEDDYCSMVGRLRDGITLPQAQAELAMIASQQAKLNTHYQGITASVAPLMSYLNRPARKILLPLIGAVALVFLIACANVAGLLLARGLQRQQEYAVRCALGASRPQLFRQVLTESLLVSLAGGVLGIGLAEGIVQSLKAVGGYAIPRLDSVNIGWPALAFCLAAVLAAAGVAGLLPAFHATRSNSTDGLKGTRTSSLGRIERRWLGGIATVQVALTMALLMGAGLLIRTMINLTSLQPGYDTENILTMDVTPMNGLKTMQWLSTQAEDLTRVAALPGVRNVAFAWGLPLTGNDWSIQIQIEGQSAAEGSKDFKDEVTIPTRSVSADYFNMMNMALVEGRDFRQSDGWYGPGRNTNAPLVAVVNQAMAKKYFAGQDAFGKRIYFDRWKTAQIIGVVADSRDGSLAQKPEPEIYVDFFQLPPFTKRLVIRTVSDPRSMIGAVQRELRAIEPTVAIDHVATMQQVRADSIASQTFAMRLLVAFSLAGTVLALVGIYGVLSLSVGSRKREIAIRMAVGAQRQNVLALILSEGLKLVVIGMIIGTVIAIGMGRLLQAFLFGVQPTDPLTFIFVVILFTAVALLACFIPARRATQIDPMNALRYE